MTTVPIRSCTALIAPASGLTDSGTALVAIRREMHA